MNDWKCAITLGTCCCTILTMATSASADYIGVMTVNKDDPDTALLCTQGNGDFVPGPLTVCNVFAGFDNPQDRLLSVGNADLQVYNGAQPDVFFQHPFNFVPYPPVCAFIPVFPDLICDSFITIGLKCVCSPSCLDGTSTDGDFDAGEFNNNGHVVGGWLDSNPMLGHGLAGNHPDLQVLFLQSSVMQGNSMSGDIDIFWRDRITGNTIAEVDVPIECAVQCVEGGSCDDGNACTDDACDPSEGTCVHAPNNDPCDDGDACTEDDQCIKGFCMGSTIDC